MAKIIIDGREVECRDGIPVLQAAIEAGLRVPHYCYHPGLSVVASCRLCLMEMKMPHPQTKELVWAPKLFPSCQTPVKEGMEVRFESDAVRGNQKHVMEYYLLNHPLDCPVCDKAGECYLQDYTEEFGPAASRMVEDKHKNPKKDIGTHTLLYQDRCVLCTRCVRFCDEVAGTGELAVVNRGNRGEIDVFPGVPLENPLQGNVVDLCPVGALLDKGFLFQQRVWLLKATPSVSPADSSGATIWIDHNEGRIHRVRPRFNERVNEWWISDEQRFGWQHVQREDRLALPQRREGGAWRTERWEALPELLRAWLTAAAAREDGAGVAAVLSPMMSCEEAYLLGRFVRGLAPRAALVLGHVPVVGTDQTFRKGFVIRAEKCPNRRGIEAVLAGLGGPTLTWGDFVAAAAGGRFGVAYVTGGYPGEWVDEAWLAGLRRVETLIVHDLFASPLRELAQLEIPGAAWAEREGTYMNADGLLQAFERAIPPREGVKFDGQFYYELAGGRGLFRAAAVRAEMAATMPVFGQVFVPRAEPEYAH
jgi:NADH-quinone oxidoreductase subunit G